MSSRALHAQGSACASARTVRRHLKGAGRKYGYAKGVLMLTASHEAQSLAWAKNIKTENLHSLHVACLALRPCNGSVDLVQLGHCNTWLFLTPNLHDLLEKCIVNGAI